MICEVVDSNFLFYFYVRFNLFDFLLGGATQEMKRKGMTKKPKPKIIKQENQNQQTQQTNENMNQQINTATNTTNHSEISNQSSEEPTTASSLQSSNTPQPNETDFSVSDSLLDDNDNSNDNYSDISNSPLNPIDNSLSSPLTEIIHEKSNENLSMLKDEAVISTSQTSQQTSNSIQQQSKKLNQPKAKKLERIERASKQFKAEKAKEQQKVKRPSAKQSISKPGKSLLSNPKNVVESIHFVPVPPSTSTSSSSITSSQSDSISSVSNVDESVSSSSLLTPVLIDLSLPEIVSYLDSVCCEVSFSRIDVEAFFQSFGGNTTIRFNRFKRLFSSFRQIIWNCTVERYFAVLDENHQGEINFKQFIKGMDQICNGTIQQQATSKEKQQHLLFVYYR